MELEAARRIVGDTPFISPVNAERVYRMIVEKKLRNVLELGIAHGTATVIMAAAIEAIGDGHITAVDLIDVDFTPSAEQQIAASGLGHFVEIVRMKSWYTWYLHD